MSGARMRAEELKGAIVGFGNVARHGHWPAYQDSRSLRIAAIVDPHLNGDGPEGLPIFPSIAAATANLPLTFVDICAPPAAHAGLVLDALERGLHAIVEKPPVVTPDEFDRVARAARARQRVVLPVHNWRHAPALRDAADAVRRGDIGTLRSATIDVWRVGACGSPGSSTWRHNRAVAGGGIVLDHGWHACYLMMEWFGGPPDTVDGWCQTPVTMDVESEAEIRLGFGGRIGVIRLTWDGPQRRNRVYLEGDSGSIDIDNAVVV